MNRLTPILIIAAGCFAAVTAAAQGLHIPVEAQQAMSFRAPIHTQADDPQGGEYGTWAAGDDFKVSFHGDMTYYPAVAEVEGQVSWHTTSIRVGAHEMVDPSDVLRHNTDWRYEYRYGQVTEAYDVRPDGVEQTFVLSSIPAAGDLVIHGRVESKLTAAEQSARHSAITFRGPGGQAIVEYGAATVIDARGRTLRITTAMSGNDVELRVPAAWLQNAAVPVTVDPLLSTVLVGTSSGLPLGSTIARDGESKQLLIGIVRRSGADTDLLVGLVDDDFKNFVLIFSDLSNLWATSEVSLAFVGGADKWAMSFTRQFTSTSRAIRYRFHQKALATFQTNYSSVPSPSGRAASGSRIGGTAAFSSGSAALMVFESDTVGTSAKDTDVWGAYLLASAGTMSQTFRLSSQGSSAVRSVDRSRPTVTPESDGGTASWIVAWQEYDATKINAAMDIRIARITSHGTQSGPATLGHTSSSLSSIEPAISGRGGRYMIAFGVTASLGIHPPATAESLYVQRFDLAETSNVVKPQTPTAIRSGAGSQYLVDSVAFDHENRSHWLVVSREVNPKPKVFADLVGYAGGVVEAMTVAKSSALESGVIYNDDTNDFAVVHGEGNNKIYGNMVRRGPATTRLYGIGCGAGTVSAVGLPHSGTEFFALHLSGVATGTNAFVSISLPFAQAPFRLPLKAIGMPGCFLNANPSLGLTTIGFVTGAGGGEVVLPIPAAVSGDLNAQMIYLNAGANALGVQATKGMVIEIR